MHDAIIRNKIALHTCTRLIICLNLQLHFVYTLLLRYRITNFNTHDAHHSVIGMLDMRSMNLKKNLFSTLSLLIMLTVLTGCGSKQKTTLTYFTNRDSIPAPSIPTDNYMVKIEPGDELFITITSLIPDATAPYNLPLSNPGMLGSLQMSTQPKIATYIVNPQGDITLPVIGTIHAAGLETTQLAAVIQKEVEKDVADALVKVELVNFRINVLGEVARPGSQSISRERFSILDAIAGAGDLTPYGERSNVLLIREENGKRTYHTINLNDVSTLSSPYFYLQQNDVVYVEPNAIRKENARYNQYSSYKISVISTVVSAVSVVASLVIALTR